MQTAIIIPIYNQEKYLVEAMEALLAQTSSDWIAYCVNDGSTDASASILADYAARDARLVVITQPNGGVSVARNTGIEAALANPRVDTCAFRTQMMLFIRVWSKLRGISPHSAMKGRSSHGILSVSLPCPRFVRRALT